MKNANYPSRKRHARPVLVAALAAVMWFGGQGTAEATHPEICPPDDPYACLAECRLHKQECLDGCRMRKRECLLEVRAEVHACKLDCRLDDTVEDVGACKRACVAEGRTNAREQCKIGRPVCVRECHPQGCAVECGLRDGDAEPADEPAPDAGDAVPSVGTAVPERCEPPIDRECLGGCARELKACTAGVIEAAEACLQGCKELRGWERLHCVHACLERAGEAAKTCRIDFRACVGECKDVSIDEPPAEGE